MSHSHYDEPDERELSEIPTGEPMGTVPVTITIPIPHVEQIVGEMARQLISQHSIDRRRQIEKAAMATLESTIDRMIRERAEPVIAEMLAKPLQPTDNYGNPTGEPTSLQALLAQRVTEWSSDIVDGEGKPFKKEAYSSKTGATRMAWMLGAVVHGELKKAVDTEVAKIVAQLKGDATTLIARQVAEKIAGTVLK